MISSETTLTMSSERTRNSFALFLFRMPHPLLNMHSWSSSTNRKQLNEQDGRETLVTGARTLQTRRTKVYWSSKRRRSKEGMPEEEEAATTNRLFVSVRTWNRWTSPPSSWSSDERATTQRRLDYAAHWRERRCLQASSTRGMPLEMPCWMTETHLLDPEL